MTGIWDPRVLLQIDEYTCRGTTKLGNRCRNRINQSDRMTVAIVLVDLAHHRPTSTTVKDSLEEIAQLCLCKRFHRATQVDDVVREWTNLIAESSPRRQRRERLSSSAIVSRADSTISRDVISPSSSFVTRASPRASTRASTVSRDVISPFSSSPSSTRASTISRDVISPSSPSSSRASTRAPTISRDVISPFSSSPSSTRASTRSSTVSRDVISPASSPSSTQASTRASTISREVISPSSPSSTRASTRASTISRDVISPSSSPPSSTRASTRSSTSQNPGESVQNRPDAALSQHSRRSGRSSTIVSPRETMPNSVESPAAPHTHHTHEVTRRPITEVCGICRDAINTPEDAVWCRAQCGQNIHRECWDLWTVEWLLQRGDSYAEEEYPNCVFCRAPWVDAETPTSPEPVPTPSRTSSSSHAHSSHEVTRRPITEECVICFDTIQNLDDAVWCRSSCGQNVHSHCWGKWSREHSSSRIIGIDMDVPPPCVFCRAPWVE